MKEAQMSQSGRHIINVAASTRYIEMLLPRWKGASSTCEPLDPTTRNNLEEPDPGQILEIIDTLGQFLEKAPMKVSLDVLKSISVHLAQLPREFFLEVAETDLWSVDVA
jgi:hypothetical protein